MTEYQSRPRPPLPSMEAPAKRPVPRPRRVNKTLAPVAALSVAGFLAVSGLLGVQVARGEDPKLGQVQVAKVEPQRVLVKKKIVTRKVVTVIPAASAASKPSQRTVTSVPAAPAHTSSSPPPATYAAPTPVQSGAS